VSGAQRKNWDYSLVFFNPDADDFLKMRQLILPYLILEEANCDTLPNFLFFAKTLWNVLGIECI
jgi:hypothetical protein